MDNKKLGILAVVAAVMVIWAWAQSQWSNRARVNLSGQSDLVQGLNPDDIARIEIGTGDDVVKIVRQEGRFVVANKANYPADPKQITDLIIKCLDIKISELYTENAKNHEDLEVTEDTARSVVNFFKADGSLLTGVVVGKSVETGQGGYVRRATEDEVYLAPDLPWFRSGAVDYVDQEIVSADREDVNSVIVTTPEGPYTLETGPGDTATMIQQPDGKTLKESDAKSVLNALDSLRFDDVNTPAALGDLDFDHLFICNMKDSTQYRLRVAKKDDKTYVKCDAKFTDTTPVTMKQGQVESEEELKKKEAKLQAQEAAQKFTLRHRGWVYEVPDWKANYLTKKQSDLLEDETPEPEEDATEAPAADPNAPAVAAPAVPADPNAADGQ